MYKILDNPEQFNLINYTAHQQSPDTTDRYCDIIKHCKEELYAIPIIEVILKSYGLDFITDIWLNTNVVETLPLDWTWFNMDRPIRMTMQTNWLNQTMLIDIPFRNIINREIDKNDIAEDKFIHLSETQTSVYFYTIMSDDYNVVAEYINDDKILIDFNF